jgi:SSS family solute:Na+ symporter
VIGSVFAVATLPTSSVLGLSADNGLVLYQLPGAHAPPLLAILVLSGIDAALTAIVAGLGIRITFLVLTPTLYGVENDLFYVPNSMFGAGFDGWATLISAVVGFGSYALVGVLRPRPTAEHEWERSELAQLHREASVELAEPAAVSRPCCPQPRTKAIHRDGSGLVALLASCGVVLSDTGWTISSVLVAE